MTGFIKRAYRELHEFSDKSIIKSLFRHEITILLKLSQKRAMLFPQSSLSWELLSILYPVLCSCMRDVLKAQKNERNSQREKREKIFMLQ